MNGDSEMLPTGRLLVRDKAAGSWAALASCHYLESSMFPPFSGGRMPGSDGPEVSNCVSDVIAWSQLPGRLC